VANDEARALRQQGIVAAKAGDKEQARALLQQSIRIEPANEAAWMWLASVARDQRERVFALQKLLELNPENDTARRALDKLMAGAPGELSAPAATQAQEMPTAPVAAFSGADDGAISVPLPSAEAVASAQKQAEQLLRENRLREAPPVRWVQKSRGRAGEADVTVLRLQIAGAVAAFALVLIVVGALLVTTNEGVRAVVFAPTATFTPTPTVTYTPTPGLTPTPSAVPRLPATPTPLPPLYVTGADLYALPQATAIYPAVLDQPLQNAVAALELGDVAAALPTLAAERRQTEAEYRAQPYYYEARALIAAGELTDARALLEEAGERETGRTTGTEQALIHSGFAQLLWAEGQAALAAGQRSRARASFDEASERAQQASAQDGRLVEPYLLLSRIHRQNREFDAALEVLDAGLAENRLPSNVDLLIEKGHVYFDRREYDLADAQAALALYVDPRTEAAHALRIASSLAEAEAGRAVLQAQDYLYYVPGSAQAWLLLGDARRAEGNDDLALLAYTQALEGEDGAVERDVLLARADLFASRQRWEQARQDLTRALQISDDTDTRARRMVAAYQAGRFDAALDDARALAGTDALSADVLNLVTARILVEDTSENGSAYRQAIDLLAPLLGPDSSLDGAERAAAAEAMARAHLGLGDAETALGFIDQALAEGETPARRLVRGLILVSLDEIDAARREFDWVLTWSELAPASVAAQAAAQLESLSG
jgi:tetratricopeptide (TPR) repeat protein